MSCLPAWFCYILGSLATTATMTKPLSLLPIIPFLTSTTSWTRTEGKAASAPQDGDCPSLAAGLAVAASDSVQVATANAVVCDLATHFLLNTSASRRSHHGPPRTQMAKQKRCSHPQGDGTKKGVCSLYNLIRTHLKFYLRMTTQMPEAMFGWAPAAGVVGSRSRILDFLGNLAMLLQVP